MHRYQLLDTINQPFLPHICTVTEQLLEIATRARFKWAQVFPHCTARQAAALASPKPTPVRQHPLCSHLHKASVLAVCCPKSPPRCTCALPVPASQPSHLPTLHGLDGVLKVTYGTNLYLISFSFFSSGLLNWMRRFRCYCLPCQTSWQQWAWGSHKAESYVSKRLMEWPSVIRRKVGMNSQHTAQPQLWNTRGSPFYFFLHWNPISTATSNAADTWVPKWVIYNPLIMASDRKRGPLSILPLCTFLMLQLLRTLLQAPPPDPSWDLCNIHLWGTSSPACQSWPEVTWFSEGSWHI